MLRGGPRSRTQLEILLNRENLAVVSIYLAVIHSVHALVTPTHKHLLNTYHVPILYIYHPV